MTKAEAKAQYRTADDLLGDWHDGILSGEPPTFFPVGDGELARLEIGPGLITLLGGAPGAGKTALVMQLVCEALSRTPSLRALVCNIEMGAPVLLDRQLARLSGIDLTTIRYRRLGPEHGDDLERGMEALDGIADRLAFVSAPFNLDNVAASADAFGADLILLDYIQRIDPPGKHADQRNAIGATMSFLRQFADAGAAIIVVAALGRSKDKQGRSTYHGEALSLASFRETSELEYGADDAFILTLDDDGDDTGDDDAETSTFVTLRHLKSRFGEMRDIPLVFDRPHQRFTPAAPSSTTKPSTKPKRSTKTKPGNGTSPQLDAQVKAAWSRTPAAESEVVA